MSTEGIWRQRVADLEDEVRRLNTGSVQSVIAALSRARAEERERAARIAESVADTWQGSEEHRASVSATAFAITDAIRASDWPAEFATVVRDPTPPHRRSAVEHERDEGDWMNNPIARAGHAQEEPER